MILAVAFGKPEKALAKAVAAVSASVRVEAL
jgi:hypothetical protein